MLKKHQYRKKLPLTLLCHPICFLALGCGTGLAPKAPGTAASLAALLIYIFWLQNFPLRAYIAVLLIVFLLGIWFCVYITKKIGYHDHPSIVIDEFVGLWVTMLASPPNVWWMIVGFILFRIFDIYKPIPINYIDKKLIGGLGIMLDDIFAGIYACVSLLSLIYLYELIIY